MAALRLCIAMLLLARTAMAQSSLPLFLEAARDPGSAEAPVTSRSLAMGGVTIGPRAPEAASANPSNLMSGGRADAVFSIGSTGLAHEELVLTPFQQPPFQSNRRRTAVTRATTAFGAGAVRGSTWAAAGFWDDSQQLRHEFTTALNHFRTTAIPGILLTEDGTGEAAFSVGITRIGGAFAAAPSSRRVSAGVSVYAFRTDVDISARVDTTAVATFSPPFTPSTNTFLFADQNAVDESAWGLGVALSGEVNVGGGVAVGARWRYEPAHAMTRRAAIGGDPPFPLTEPVEFDPPDTLAFTASVSAGRTTVSAELARHAYERVYGPLALPDSSFSLCQTLRTSDCHGWGFGNYLPVDALAFRAGVEQGISVGRGVFYLRGGLVFEEGYSLARPKDDPTINGEALPAPVIPTPLTPPRDGRATVSGGAGYAWRGVEIAGGLSYAASVRRFLIDVRVGAR